jgi:xylose dehydrogenase (NAD/NADP)
MLRWGLLSTARINRRIIPAIRASKIGVISAVASRDQATANAYAAQWEIPRAFGSYEAMLTPGTVDIVYISLPNHLHASWSIRAMQAGLHVLCEKPLALSVAEVDEIIKTSQETGRLCAEAFMYRHHPQTKIAGDWAHSGRLGEICSVQGAFHFAFEQRQNIRLVPEYGGGSLWDVGVYPLSFAQYIMGEPPVWVAGSQWIGASGVEENFNGQLTYSGDRMAQISSSFRSPYFTSFNIFGTEGCLFMNRPFNGLDEQRHLFFLPKTGQMEEISVPEKELYLGEIEDMHTAILDQKPNYLTLLESRNHILTVRALYESAAKNESVRLE